MAPTHVPPAASKPGWLLRAGVIGLAVFALAQVILPLRHWAYPGNVQWNEDGYRFAWRVLLTEKTGHLRFRVTDRTTGEEWLAYPGEYLSPIQAERMAYQPDMILATARIIAQDEYRRGRDVQVRADAFVTYNGREVARFIDPEVDLARIEPGLAPNTWVLPAPTGS